MKHLPNFFTLLNLLFGCIAIVHILTVHPFLSTVAGDETYYVYGMDNMYWGSVFIGLAAIMDILDGWMARLTNSYSYIGKDLDSLADLVSFGVAPSMIVFQLLWKSYMQEPGALEAPMWVLIPAFLLALAAALRLAKFNQTHTAQKHFFTGLPTPAAGILVASLPLILFQNPLGWGEYLENRWVLYGIVLLMSWLMVSKIRFFKWQPAKGNIRGWLPQVLVLAVLVIGTPIIHFAVIPVAFFFYLILTLLFKPKEQALAL